MADDIRAHPYRHEEKLAMAEKQWQRKEASWAEAEARYQVYLDDVCDCSPVHDSRQEWFVLRADGLTRNTVRMCATRTSTASTLRGLALKPPTPSPRATPSALSGTRSAQHCR